MNLGDQIKSSARAQVNRYRPADDLIPRIEHRRRQRVARRITASSIAAVVLFGGGALGLAALRDRGNDGAAVANSTVIDSTVAPTVVATTTTTPATDPTTTVVGDTLAQASTTSPAATQPTTPPRPSDALVPNAYAEADGSTGVNEFWNIPQYGSEDVRGSGCGATGGLGETIPDGLWAGFITGTQGGMVDIDIVCIYHGASAQTQLANPTATIVSNQPDYLIVNNATRARTMPMDANISLRLSERDTATRCVDTGPTTQWSDIPPDRQVWIRVHNGAVTWVLADCPPS